MTTRPPTAGEELLGALALTTLVWSLLLCPALLPEGLRPGATILSYLAVLVLVLALGRARCGKPDVGAWLLGALGVVAGWLSFPAWIVFSIAVGRSLGLPDETAVAPWTGSPWGWSVVVLLAPVLEEALYRERVLTAAAGYWGPAAGVLASSVLFAAPHLEPWAVLVTFELGLVLGALRLGARSLAPCIGVHTGLNAASVSLGVPGSGLHPLTPVEAALVGSALLCAVVLLARRQRAPRPLDVPIAGSPPS